MGKINMNELTKEQIQKAMACESVEELIELAKSEGIELTKEEAEALCYSVGLGADQRCNRGGGIAGA